MSSYDPFDETQKQLEQMRSWMKQRRLIVLGAFGFLFIVVGVWTAYYQVERDEVGVLLRFGEHIKPNAGPGLHFKAPFGIDQVVKVPVERQLKMEFGFRTVSAGVQSKFSQDRHALAEAKMVTGLRNVAVVEWIIQYKIAEPEKYLFRFRDIDTTLRLMAEATMRGVVGDYTIDELITGQRENIEDQAQQKLQELNRVYDTGIVIQQLKLQDANVPDPVKQSLREVEEAKQEKARMINEAETARNTVIPEAKGKAKEKIAQAEGYAIARINTAEGDVARFRSLQKEYKKAKEVTRTRLYLEALGDVFPQVKRKIIVDAETKGLVPLLNLGGGEK